jgi:SAM-dependent MidA family methyltransferase
VNPSGLSVQDNPVLKELIAARISDAGCIGFDEFMHLALYHPEHGYYFACDPTLDYQSSPNVHPVFGAMIARQVARFWRHLGEPSRFDLFEAGAGNLRLAAAVLQALRSEEPALFEAVRYLAQDVTLREDTLAEDLQPFGEKVAFAAALPEEAEIEGCVLSNELLDAMPFRRAHKRAGRLYELRVALQGNRFVDIEAEPPLDLVAYFAALGLEPGEGCEAEVNLEAREWIGRAARALKRGYVLTLDYGYEAVDLYAPWRKRGTLLTFYRHTAGEDPYVRIGRQDITASVDFTTIRAVGEAEGLRAHSLETQTDLLTSLGIGETLAGRPDPNQLEAFYALRRAVFELTDPSGLGRIRALIQGKNAPEGAGGST